MVVLAPCSPPERDVSPADHLCHCKHERHLSQDVRMCSSSEGESQDITSAEVLSLDVVRAACTPLWAPDAGSPLSLIGDALRGRLGPGTSQASAVLADASPACFAASRPSATALRIYRGCRSTSAMESARPVSRYRAFQWRCDSQADPLALLCWLVQQRLACSRLSNAPAGLPGLASRS